MAAGHGVAQLRRRLVGMSSSGGLCYLGANRDELTNDVFEPFRMAMIGAEPSENPILRWWNFVGWTRDEFIAADR